MPIYDYSCEKCSKEVLNVIVKTYNEPVVCSCGERMEKNICAPKLMGFDKFGTSKKKESC